MMCQLLSEPLEPLEPLEPSEPFHTSEILTDDSIFLLMIIIPTTNNHQLPTTNHLQKEPIL